MERDGGPLVLALTAALARIWGHNTWKPKARELAWRTVTGTAPCGAASRWVPRVETWQCECTARRQFRIVFRVAHKLSDLLQNDYQATADYQVNCPRPCCCQTPSMHAMLPGVWRDPEG